MTTIVRTDDGPEGGEYEHGLVSFDVQDPNSIRRAMSWLEMRKWHIDEMPLIDASLRLLRAALDAAEHRARPLRELQR